jgi:hypothetical protein
MRTYLIITIDVEPDCSPSWQYSDPLTFNGVKIGIKEKLQPVFNKYQITPTYLINNVVLEDISSVEILKNLDGNFELGTHLHPEFIEPDKTVFNYAGSKGEANCCFYDPDIEYYKIKNITDLFESNFGFKPLSFRAGRYSAGFNTIRSIEKLGYLIDTSVSPHIIWDDKTREKPVDYRMAYDQPYFIRENSFLEMDNKGKILEVPISICPLRNNLCKEYILSFGGLRRNIRKVKHAWLRPVYSSFNELIEIVQYFQDRKSEQNMVVLNMMFHNVEVIPQLSPYTRNLKDAENYLNDLMHFFAFCKRKQIESIALKDLYKLMKHE